MAYRTDDQLVAVGSALVAMNRSPLEQRSRDQARAHAANETAHERSVARGTTPMYQNKSPIEAPTTMTSGPRSTARPGGSAFADLCLAALPPGRILNLGAGYPATPVRSGVINLDLDPRVLDGNANGVAADVTFLPFTAGVFDGALLKDVLEHVPDPVRALGEVHRVCRPGAEIIVTVPRAIPRAVWADPSHLRGFTAGSLRWTAELSGWEPVGRLDRIGSIPGAGRFPMVLRHAHQILRVPGLGHLLGTNWLMTARRSD